MIIELGTKIREFRKRDGRTQEELSAAIGVTGQAVSRWEMGQGYPDMELLPSIANYFGVHIDELFGYDSDREAKIKAYIARHDALELDQEKVEEQLSLIRQAVAEFPAEERLLIRLAETLCRYGWKMHGGRCYTTEDCDYAINDTAYGTENAYWQEELTVLRRVLAETKDAEIRERAVNAAVHVMWSLGLYGEAEKLANEQPAIISSREILRVYGTDGQESDRYAGEAIIALVNTLSDMVQRVLSMRVSLAKSNVQIEKLRGLIDLYELIFDDGNFGFAHVKVMDLYLSLVYQYVRQRMLDEAFDCLDKAKHHAVKYDRLFHAGTHRLTAALVDKVTEETDKWIGEAEKAENLSGMWQLTFDEEVRAILTADPRWDELFPAKTE